MSASFLETGRLNELALIGNTRRREGVVARIKDQTTLSGEGSAAMPHQCDPSGIVTDILSEQHLIGHGQS